jgi:cell wall-associated NlpC family hydrolase
MLSPERTCADTQRVLRTAFTALLLFAVAAGNTASAGRPPARSFAAAEISTVVGAGLMAPSVASFRPDEPLTAGELAVVVASLGGAIAVDDPDAPVPIRELDARLVRLAGLRPAARTIREAAVSAGIDARPWLGTETVARLLGFRINHLRDEEELEPQVSDPATRAEAAYSIAKYLALDPTRIETVRTSADMFTLPTLTDWRRLVLERALRFVGSPYVFAGTSERPQQLFGKVLPGGFDCSGFVWRVFKLQAFAGSPRLSRVLQGRTSYSMSAEVPRSKRLSRSELEPGDVVFFGAYGTRSKPSEVGHVGIYVGNDWIVHSSRFGTTLTPMTGWYETSFAWARSPLLEAGLES